MGRTPKAGRSENTIDDLGVRLKFLRSQLNQNTSTAFGAVLVVSMLATGCATPPPADDPEALAAYREANDPLEPMNRAIFDFNTTLDRYFLRPVAWGWKEGVPLPIRNIIRNFIDNLKTPVIFVNDVFQWEWDRAGYTAIRGIMNSTLGFGGVADIASDMGFPRHSEDFGQTLAVYDTGSGPYLMVPFLGPSNPRDLLGRGVDTVVDPLTWANIPTEWSIGATATDIVDGRARNFSAINELERTSLDYYATVRSLFWQRRKSEINNGRTSSDIEPGSSLLDDLERELNAEPNMARAN